jgi:asparagine synthase (glutamine-hydrolysing)
MCGIFGVVPAERTTIPDESAVWRSAALLEHRGPDSNGVHVAPGIGLAHTRLALLDLNPRSAQPFWDTDRKNCLVYNGEIYNFRQLRKDLENEGIDFRTTSDTEVVLNSVLHWGIEAAINRFEGMFAFAIWSAVTGEVILARDRFGIKPLFLAYTGQNTLFTSEIQALRGWMEPKGDMRTVIAYLYGSGGPTKGQTFIEDVMNVPPASIVRLRPGETPHHSTYFQLGEFWNEESWSRLAGAKTKALVDEVESALMSSVQSQLVADAPVGVLCSGGVDSSLILAMAARTHTDLKVFHANVVGPKSETAAANRLATHLGLDLEVVEVYDDDFIELLPKLSRHTGSPFHLTPHSVPFYRVSQLVRDSGVKAVLSGEGADEAYLGYPWLVGSRKKSSGLADIAPSKTQMSPVADLLTGMLERFEVESDHESNESSLLAINGIDRRRVLQSLGLMNANLRALLHRNDAMGMAASIESRFPYLDTQLIRHAINLPPSSKIRRGPFPTDRRHPLIIDKWILRRVADRYIPKGLSRRAKIPFSTSAYRRLQIDPRLFVGGFLDDYLRMDLGHYERLVKHADKTLQSKLVHLETWGRVMVRGEDDNSVGTELKRWVTVLPTSV